jgi:hypothetical protein
MLTREGSCMNTVKVSPPHGESAASVLPKRLTAIPPRLRARLVALACIAAGLPATGVAPRGGRHRGGVDAWGPGVHAQGLTGLPPTCRGPPGPVLRPAALPHRRHAVPRPPRQVGLQTGAWAGNAGAASLQRPCKPTLASAPARRYRHPLGGRRKRPRQPCAQAPPEAPQALAHAWADLEPQREPGSVTVDMDQGHLWPDALPRLGGFVRGQPAWVHAPSPPQRDTRLCAVAVVRPLGRVRTRRCPWCPPEPTAQFLAQGRRGLRGRRRELVLANAPPHQGARAEEARARAQRIAPRVPPSSPQMNAADPWIGWAKAV